ncbi:adhesion G protein-coupled receptor E3-like [Astyanax mexicanus]|uniref:Adhesion G protein-coupled receptor E3-like n=1 Tax=Astyanax mexicanus TaxID=7994 RepID=A0A8T2KTF1_ASTMX|nr:adhesion G protein-coupled receptor E3-like [Astyanax mexicanus]
MYNIKSSKEDLKASILSIFSDVCLNHSVLRDPWRNIGFDSASLPGGRRTDQNLVEGWYQLGGVGGDSLVLSCSNFSSTQSLSSILPNSTSPTNFQLYTCDSVYWSSSISCTQQNIHSLDCGQGWYLYYLVKTSGLYSTRQSNCSNSPCGEHAQCGLPYGSCSCNPGLSIPEGFEPTGDSYGYLIINQAAKCKKTFSASCAVDFLNQLKNSKATIISQNVVSKYLGKILTSINVLKVTADPKMLVTYGNTVLGATETLLFVMGINMPVNYILNFIHQELESVGAIITSYSTLFSLLITTNNTTKTMMSSVVSAKLIPAKILFSKSANFTLKHIQVRNPDSNLTCVSWTNNTWTTQDCYLLQTNSSHSVCSCSKMSIVALIMETGPPKPIFPETEGNQLLDSILNKTFTKLPENVVVDTLTKVMNNTMVTMATNDDKVNKVEYANTVIMATEKLVSALVTKVENYSYTPIKLPNLEIQVLAIGPNVSYIPPLRTSTADLDIDLIQMAKKNNGSAAVAFLSYTNVTNMMAPDLFTTNENTTKTMMSTVVSATLIKITDTKLTKPVNFTFKHTADLIPDSNLTCVYWNNKAWVVDGCNLLQTNRSHTVCSCDHLSTFALIMQTKPPKDDVNLDLLNTVLVSVGLVFLSLDLLTFAVCRRHLRMNNTPRINLCISLLLAHLTLLLTQKFIHYIQPLQLLCAVLAGVLHFLFLSAFVWMLIEAVLLFISVKNLKKIRSKQKEVLSWKWLIIIGYLIPLVVVGVSVGLFSDGYGTLFIIIIVLLRSALAGLNSDVSQFKEIKILVFKTLVQSAILGCPWILGFFTEGSQVLEMVFLFLNSQQGTFIFLVYCVLNQEVRQQYRKWMVACCPFFQENAAKRRQIT